MIANDVSTLKIHKLTQEQYNRELAAGSLDENALYLTPEEDIVIADVIGLQDVLDGKSDDTHVHDEATTSVSGFMSSVDKEKLDGIEYNAKNVFIQDSEPSGANADALWIDTSVESIEGSSSGGGNGVGIASVVQTTTSTADDGNNVITVTLTDGTKSTFTVQNGSKGSTPVKGTDYFTAADKAEIIADILEQVENGNEVAY